MVSFLFAIVAAIVEGLLEFFTSTVFVKLFMAAMVYVFLFTLLPLLISYLVPSTLMNAVGGLFAMLNGQLWGQQIAYILDWLCVLQLLQVWLPMLIVRFLFRRI